jgi:quercetin dioxygenase-like cupin family protein
MFPSRASIDKEGLMRIAAATLLALLASAVASSARPPSQPEYKRVEKLYEGNRSIIGETIRYPQGDPVDIRSLIVTLQPGETTGWHKHGVPTYGYNLEGGLTVDYGEKGKRVYRTGEAFMEAMDWSHNGSNEGALPARVLVVFIGAKDHDPVIRKDAPKETVK